MEKEMNLQVKHATLQAFLSAEEEARKIKEEHRLRKVEKETNLQTDRKRKKREEDTVNRGSSPEIPPPLFLFWREPLFLDT